MLAHRVGGQDQGGPARAGCPEPSQPYVLGDLTIDYAERRVSLAGRPVQLIANEYRTLAELSTYAGAGADLRAPAETGLGGSRTTPTFVRCAPSLPACAASWATWPKCPTYILTELRVGYRIAKGDKPDQVTP